MTDHQMSLAGLLVGVMSFFLTLHDIKKRHPAAAVISLSGFLLAIALVFNSEITPVFNSLWTGPTLENVQIAQSGRNGPSSTGGGTTPSAAVETSPGGGTTSVGERKPHATGGTPLDSLNATLERLDRSLAKVPPPEFRKEIIPVVRIDHETGRRFQTGFVAYPSTTVHYLDKEKELVY